MTEPRTIEVPAEAAKERLDQFLSAQMDGVSRSRVQMLLDQGDVLVSGKQQKASYKLRGGETIEITGEPRPAPLKATPEAIPLDVIFEDKDLAVVNKPAGMMVHAGSGQGESARNQGTLVNALLHRFNALSAAGGELRPGIVHRLDKETSGLILVAKNDRTHLALAEMFSSRSMMKTYIALVHGAVEKDSGTIAASVGRDPLRRTRMTTRPIENARTAISHYEVVQRISSRFGKFTLVRVRIETGRTHQIRVHMASINHPVVGDSLYGAAGQLTDLVAAQGSRTKLGPERLKLGRNFLHAAELEFTHPSTKESLQLKAPLPVELTTFLAKVEDGQPPVAAGPKSAKKPASTTPQKPAAWALPTTRVRKSK